MSLAQRYAEEHKRFLEEHNPDVLRKQSDPTSYLSSVGQEAEDRHLHLMLQHNNSKEVQKLPHLDRVRELQSRNQEVSELVRHDLIHQPLKD